VTGEPPVAEFRRLLARELSPAWAAAAAAADAEELARLAAGPGGARAIAIVAAKRIVRRPGLRRTPAGVEHWKETSAGPLLTRRANIPWLIAAFERQGLFLRHRLPTQVTELYVKPPWEWMKNSMYTLNDYWYRRVGISQLAVGNTLIFQRAESSVRATKTRLDPPNRIRKSICLAALRR